MNWLKKSLKLEKSIHGKQAIHRGRMKPWSRRTQLWRKKELREVRTAISKLESNVPSVVEKNVGALEEEILELKSAISKLESRSRSATPVPRQVGSDDAFKKEVNGLTDQEWQVERWLET
ncbi:hypothetical protein RHGRI_037043 [Rhododendron griersonianum]|uniref:Uncharacterized protein n=1 Tax=Rhododendron griersonianum TaxID=479676 RepID=A0AAV6HRE5_9ERIC|nr:hypothetical protein RHGRI_037043 [Rhododendron griersonianum]